MELRGILEVIDSVAYEEEEDERDVELLFFSI